MMMISRDISRCGSVKWRCIFGVVLSLVMAQLNAEVLVNNIENNGKVISETLSKQDAVSNESGLIAGNKKNWQLRAEQWQMARTGESILSLPVLNQVINAWLRDKQKKIEIQYPGGEEGEFWVQELSDWLVSLAIPSSRMSLTPGSGADDMISFSIIK